MTRLRVTPETHVVVYDCRYGGLGSAVPKIFRVRRACFQPFFSPIVMLSHQRLGPVQRRTLVVDHAHFWPRESVSVGWRHGQVAPGTTAAGDGHANAGECTGHTTLCGVDLSSPAASHLPADYGNFECERGERLHFVLEEMIALLMSTAVVVNVQNGQEYVMDARSAGRCVKRVCGRRHSRPIAKNAFCFPQILGKRTRAAPGH